MASAIVRSGLRTALRNTNSIRTAAPKRSFSSSSSPIEEAREASKWEKISYLGAATCTGLAIYHLSGEHPHFDEPPTMVVCCLIFFVEWQAYPYLHIRNKEFPWGPDGLFEVKHH